MKKNSEELLKSKPFGIEYLQTLSEDFDVYGAGATVQTTYAGTANNDFSTKDANDGADVD